MEFEAFPKIPRFREMVVTEKIDGTNVCVAIEQTTDGRAGEYGNVPYTFVPPDLCVYAQSRKRLITPKDDNFGFAGWVSEHAEVLASILGPGRHYGEWWGKGIRRGYGMHRKVFSLFNTKRWCQETLADEQGMSLLAGLDVVPLLYTGAFGTTAIRRVLWELEQSGSAAAPGFMRPEGVVVYQPNADRLSKMTLNGDGGKFAS